MRDATVHVSVFHGVDHDVWCVGPDDDFDHPRLLIRTADVLMGIRPELYDWSTDPIDSEHVDFAKALATAAVEYAAEVERIYTLQAFTESDDAQPDDEDWDYIKDVSEGGEQTTDRQFEWS